MAEQTEDRVCRICGFTGSSSEPGERCPDHSLVLVRSEVVSRYGSDELLGRTLGDKYAILDVLGRGGMGFVYAAIQLPVGRWVAVKVIRFRAGQDNHAELRGRFFREARVMAQLSSPATVRLYDYGEDGDLLFIALERVAGPSLRQVLRQEKRLPADRAVHIALHVLDALEEAHGMGLVHRDIKPPNVLLAPGPGGQEQAKVLDFGVAKVLDAGEEDELTRTGVAVGTPKYMAPEQVRRIDVGPSADLYALGVVLYEMLAGHTPFHGRRGYDLLTAHVKEPPPPLDPELKVPPALEQAVMKALAKEVVDRYPDAVAMRRELHAAMDLSRTVMSSPPLFVATSRPPRPEDPETPLGLTDSTMGELAEGVQGPRSRAVLYGSLALVAIGMGLVLVTLAAGGDEPAKAGAASAPVVADAARTGADAAVTVVSPPVKEVAAVPDAAVAVVVDAARPDAATPPPKPVRRRAVRRRPVRSRAARATPRTGVRKPAKPPVKKPAKPPVKKPTTPLLVPLD